MELARRVARNALYNSTSIVLGSASGLFLTIILAKVLKPENFGVYSLAIVVGTLCVNISTIGIDNAVVRYIAFYYGKGDLAKMRAHFRHFAKVKAMMTFLVSSALILSANYLAEIFNSDSLTVPFVIAGILVVAASLSDFLASFMMGLQRFEYILVRKVVYEVSRWLFIIPLAFTFLAIGAVLGAAVAYLISAITLMFVVFRKYSKVVFGSTSSISEGVYSYMGFATVASIAGIIYAYIDTIMIGYLLDTTNVGFYRAAYTLVFAFVGLASSLAIVLLPSFTQLSKRDIENSLERINKYVSLTVFPTAILISFFSNQIILFLYGEDYYVAGDVMKILSLVIIPGGFSYLGSILNAKERTDLRALVSLSGMLLNIFLNYFLITHCGVTGAAIATVVSRFLVLFLIVFVLTKSLKINSKIDLLKKPLFASVILALTIFLLPSPSNLVVGILEVLFGLIIYYMVLIALRFIGSNDLKYFTIVALRWK